MDRMKMALRNQLCVIDSGRLRAELREVEADHYDMRRNRFRYIGSCRVYDFPARAERGTMRRCFRVIEGGRIKNR